MKGNRGTIFIAFFLFIGVALSPCINASFDIATNEIISLNNGNHPPIHIDGNDDFTLENGVTGGNGTENDPYIIEDWIIIEDGSASRGIFINNTDAYFVIRNCTVCNFSEMYDIGIRFNNVENGRIETTTSFRTQKAIAIYYSTQIEIFNCTSDSYSSVWFASGVYCYSSSYVTISSCDFHGKGFGIHLFETSYSVIDNSSCHNSSFYGIDISGKQSEYNTIKDCKLFNNCHEGIRIYADDRERHSTYTQIIRCEIYNNGLLPDADNGEPGITIWNVHENIIEDCNIHHNGEGIVIDASRGNIIRNCSIFGHYLESGMLAEGIVVTRDIIGLIKVQNNEITNCDIYDNEIGIFTVGTLSVKIEKNNVSNNSYFGIFSLLSFLSHINDNNLYNNGGFVPSLDSSGVYCLGGFIDVRNNWWGSSRGPSLLLFPFRGDKLKHRFGWALYRPWATEPIPDAGVN